MAASASFSFVFTKPRFDPGTPSSSCVMLKNATLHFPFPLLAPFFPESCSSTKSGSRRSLRKSRRCVSWRDLVQPLELPDKKPELHLFRREVDGSCFGAPRGYIPVQRPCLPHPGSLGLRAHKVRSAYAQR